jgi:hypothetical protein
LWSFLSFYAFPNARFGFNPRRMNEIIHPPWVKKATV